MQGNPFGRAAAEWVQRIPRPGPKDQSAVTGDRPLGASEVPPGGDADSPEGWLTPIKDKKRNSKIGWYPKVTVIGGARIVEKISCLNFHSYSTQPRSSNRLM
jgi:hypothetical protein